MKIHRILSVFSTYIMEYSERKNKEENLKIQEIADRGRDFFFRTDCGMMDRTERFRGMEVKMGADREKGKSRKENTEAEIALINRLAESEHPEKILESAQPFMELMSRYRCAMMEVETKLRVLDEEFSLTYDRNPFETIKSRLKRPVSIIEKMKRRGYPLTVEEIEKRLNDIAGIRVICSFPDDIYRLADMLIRQDDIRLVQKKDYIVSPKPNGYRSLHLILEVPIFLSDSKRYMKVEVQFRTIAMDFWASLDHKLKYKKDVQEPERIAAQLKECADIISSMDERMQQIRDQIETGRTGDGRGSGSGPMEEA